MRSAVTLALLAGALAGCGGLAHYETREGEPTRLDGSEPAVPAVPVAQAVVRPAGGRFFARGYLYLPRDDERRLCALMSATRGCGGPSLVLANPDAVRSLSAKGVLAHGCCTIGAWSPREVVVHVWLHRDRRAFVLG